MTPLNPSKYNFIVLKSLIVLLGLGWFNPYQLKGQEVKEQDSKYILSNLDTLNNLWFIKASTHQRNKRATALPQFQPNTIPDYPDSVYESRLKKMSVNTPMAYVYNDKVRAFINLYAFRKRDLVEKMLGLSEYYFPIYEEIFDKYGIPLEVRYLSVVESALNTEAVSPANAVGLWQFMYPTGRMYHLNVTSYMDERKDPVKSTEAAAQYLKEMHNIFLDWFLVMAAYNCGPGNVIKAIRRSGGKRNFWDIYPYLPSETRGYVPAYIAASYVFTYHKEHNLLPQLINLPTYVDTVLVKKEVNFKTLAKYLKMDERVIKELNPHFTKSYIPAGQGQIFPIRLPNQQATVFNQFEDSIYKDYSENKPKLANFRTVQKPIVKLTTDSTPKDSNQHTSDSLHKIVSSSNNENTSVNINPSIRVQYTWLAYYVKPNDNITSIAGWFDVSIYQLRYWNHLGYRNPRIGKRLVILVPEAKLDYYSKINLMTSTQKKYLKFSTSRNNTSTELPPEAATKQVRNRQIFPRFDNQSKKLDNKKSNKGNTEYYKVQKGDTIWSISQKFPGVSVDDIKRANNLKDNRQLKSGTTIKIVKG